MDNGVNPGLHLGDEVAQVVALGDVAGDHRLTACAFPGNDVGCALRTDVRDFGECHGRSTDAAQAQRFELFNAFPFFGCQSHDQVIPADALINLGDSFAIDGLLHLLGCGSGGESRCGEIQVAIANGQGSDGDLTIGGHVARARQRSQFRFNLFGNIAQLDQIFTVDVDGDGGGRPGQNVRQPMFNGLPNHGGNTGNVSENRVDALTNFLFGFTRRYGDFDFRTARRLSVFVAFGTTGAPRNAFHSADFRESLFNSAGHAIGFAQ